MTQLLLCGLHVKIASKQTNIKLRTLFFSKASLNSQLITDKRKNAKKTHKPFKKIDKYLYAKSPVKRDRLM